MPEVDPPPLAFGTVAAIFESPEAALRAADALAQTGYPRSLVTVLMGQPWEKADRETTGIVPDENLRMALVPATPHDRASLAPRNELPAELVTFAGPLTERTRGLNPAVFPLIAIVVSVIAILVTMFVSQSWIPTTIVTLIALHGVVAVMALSFGGEHIASFPFRTRIPTVEDALERGGALVTVRCTLPYRSVVETTMSQAGGEVLGYAPRIAYPVPAA